MAKERAASPVSVFQEFFQGGLYKRSQGRVTRQVTFAALAIAVALGVWKLMNVLRAFVDDPVLWFGLNFNLYPVIIYGVPGLLLLLGWWASYRAVNMNRFADFLIAVEAEMNKVTWPTRDELIRSSMVVIVVIFFLALLLFVFDLFWRFLFQLIGVLK